MTPRQATIYLRGGRKKRGPAVRSDADAIELSRRHRLKVLAEARALMGK